MTFNSNQLIENLIQQTKENLNHVEKFKNLSTETLNWKENEKRWSILECIEHLNLYGDFYIQEIGKRIASSSSTASENFKSGKLGNYFAKIMLPGAKPMNTFKDKNPSGSNLSKQHIERFEDQQKKMLDLLNQARTVNLKKVKTGISISKIVKLRLGDTFRVVINHNQRHVYSC